MFTYKQLEAVFWIAKLGGFAPAARKLNTTQSAISKRVQELESSLGTALFDRDRRQARLSDKGEEMLLLATRLLEERDAAMEQLGQPGVVSRRVRIGVTELTSMTWLPRLVSAVRDRYPKVIIEPDVDASMSLRDKLLTGEMDVIIVPKAIADSRLVIRPVGSVELTWMCKPGMLPSSRVVTLQELTSHTVIVQGSKSGTAVQFDPILRSKEFQRSNTITSNNMLAMIGLTIAGLGVTYLPHACLKPLIARRALSVVKTDPRLPIVDYVAMYKTTRTGSLVASIADLAAASCDFSELFQLVLKTHASARVGAHLFGRR